MGIIEKFEEFEGEGAKRYRRGAALFAPVLYGHVIKDMKTLGVRGEYLEAGCGPGILAIRLAKELGVKVTAFDISEDMIEIARSAAREMGVEVEFRVGDVEKDYFGEFDLVYSTFSLHHWSNPERGLRNLWSMVKPGGYLYILDVRRSLYFKHGLSLREFKSLFERAGIKAEIKNRFHFMVLSLAIKPTS